QRSEAAAQTVNRHLDRPLAHAETFGQLAVSGTTGLGQERCQGAAAIRVGRGRDLLVEAPPRLGQQLQRPLAREQTIGTLGGVGLQLVAPLGPLQLEREMLPAAAAPFRSGGRRLVRDVVLEGAQEERAKTTALAIGAGDETLLQ